MSSFLQRLKKKSIVPETPEDKKREKIEEQKKEAETAAASPVEKFDQLKVDIFQTQAAIIIYAQIAGASIHDFGVLIEGDGDIVTIKGQRNRPNGEHFEAGTDGKENILEECSWGKFYRQIILPTEVEASKTEAKMKDGVLMLFLPLRESSEKGVRIDVKEL